MISTKPFDLPVFLQFFPPSIFFDPFPVFCSNTPPPLLSEACLDRFLRPWLPLSSFLFFRFLDFFFPIAPFLPSTFPPPSFPSSFAPFFWPFPVSLFLVCLATLNVGPLWRNVVPPLQHRGTLLFYCLDILFLDRSWVVKKSFFDKSAPGSLRCRSPCFSSISPVQRQKTVSYFFGSPTSIMLLVGLMACVRRPSECRRLLPPYHLGSVGRDPRTNRPSDPFLAALFARRTSQVRLLAGRRRRYPAFATPPSVLCGVPLRDLSDSLPDPPRAGQRSLLFTFLTFARLALGLDGQWHTFRAAFLFCFLTPFPSPNSGNATRPISS